MENDILKPWYAVETDADKQRFYNRPQTSVYVYEPPAKPKRETYASAKNVYRPADVVLMELTVKTRKDIEKTEPFEWPDDFYCGLCVSWYNEQIKRGLCDIAYLCGDEAERAAGRYVSYCIACWYADGGVACFIPTQKEVDGITKPVIEETKPSRSNYRKPEFADNAPSFKEALQTIADYTEFEWWKNRFLQGLSVMEQNDVSYCGQENTFPIPQPYFKYLLAAQLTQLGTGMGSWYDLPTMGSESHKRYTNLFTAERDKALMYAINNC